jgi:hypothetical protein
MANDIALRHARTKFGTQYLSQRHIGFYLAVITT